MKSSIKRRRDYSASWLYERQEPRGAVPTLRPAPCPASNEHDEAPHRTQAEAGDRHGAEALALKAAAGGDFFVLRDLERMRTRAGDLEGTEVLHRKAADASHFHSLHRNKWPYGLNPDGSPVTPGTSE